MATGFTQVANVGSFRWRDGMLHGIRVQDNLFEQFVEPR